MRGLSLAILICTAIPAQAASLRCQSDSYCNNSRGCSEQNQQMTIRDNGDGTATFGWSEEFVFTAPVLHKDGYDLFISNDQPAATQVLTIGPDSEATFTVTMISRGKLSVSIYPMRCSEFESK